MSRDRGRHEDGDDRERDGEDELPETITVRVRGGASITLDDDGITLDNGKGAVVRMRGPAVEVNDGALEVT
ncbi:hypothetical protein ACOCJ5_02080 [Knoellia sp. CPCC 206450]|uniref:hypothetical protein n=1 Tax=Knoellia tibetensis TaxID=3404798 RepID=UPI003B43AD0C